MTKSVQHQDMLWPLATMIHNIKNDKMAVEKRFFRVSIHVKLWLVKLKIETVLFSFNI